jgi:hypothetical protein
VRAEFLSEVAQEFGGKSMSHSGRMAEIAGFRN